jgi:two-component system cell cycle sensor histidine kinase/response regulator CckA
VFTTDLQMRFTSLNLAGEAITGYTRMVINGYSAELAACLEPSDPRREQVLEICKAGESAVNLTRQLLAFSRSQILHPRVIDLTDVVMGLSEMLRRLIGADVEFITVSAPDLQRIKVDPGQIEQVIMNLVFNARDAMPAGGRLTIETANTELDAQFADRHPGARPGSYVRLAVTDTGVGMHRETRSRLFEPFFTTKEPGKGTGLGLATVYGIVQQSGAFIAVDTEAGRGSVFEVYFPAVDE